MSAQVTASRFHDNRARLTNNYLLSRRLITARGYFNLELNVSVIIDDFLRRALTIVSIAKQELGKERTRGHVIDGI